LEDLIMKNIRSYLDNPIENGLDLIGSTDKIGVNALRIAFAIIFLWIGALKFVHYEADSITPFVANSPFLSFFYKHPELYQAHLTHEGQLVPAQRDWHQANNTYAFSTGLGLVEITIGLMVLLNPVSSLLGLIGGFLAFTTPIVTLSFLITTPEAWVQNLGDAEYGFPYLSGAGRLVLKDTAILAGGILVMADSARTLLARIRARRQRASASKQLGIA